MKIKLYNEVNPNYTALQQVLSNRGIPIEEQEEWLNAGWNDINDWRLLGENKLQKAVELVNSVIKNEKKLAIVIDSDQDGYTSGAIFINYLNKIDNNYVLNHIKWYHHSGKEHGLQDVLKKILSDGEVSLVVVPDAGSNNIEEHAILEAKGIDCLVLDHHMVDRIKDDNSAIIINPQICDYPNKNITGAGVVWQFCRAFDEIKNYNFANDFIDIAALGACGDMADYRNLEIRALVNIGFNNIRNPYFAAMSKKNDYSIQKMNGINYYSAAFYVTPLTNAVTRSATMEEKEIVFKSFLEPYAFTEIESSKRGHKGEIVPLVDEAVLIAERVKRRQTKLQDEAIGFLEKKIEEEQLLNNAILLFLCEPGDVERNLQGLVANKFQAKYQKPCAVLTKNKTKDDEEYFYRGSMRNYGQSERQDLKSDLEATDLIEFCAGHENAAGLSIPEKNISGFLQTFNKLYKDVDQTPIYMVDYIWNTKIEMREDIILDIADFNIYGQNIPESFVALNRIPIAANIVTLMSPDKHPTLKIQIGNIALIKFGSSQEEYKKFCGEDLVLTCICKCNKNEWNGNISPQLIIESYELHEEWIF